MSRKIIGVTVGTSLPKPNFDQTDPRKGDYIKNKPDFDGLKSKVEEIEVRVDTMQETAYDDTELRGIVSENVAKTDTLNELVGNTKVETQISDAVATLESEIDDKLDAMQSAIDSKVDAVDGMGLSTNDYTTSEKNKLATVEDNANFYEHPVHDSHSSGLYKITVDESGHVSDATLVGKDDIVALGIPAQDTTYEQEISELNKAIGQVDSNVEGNKDAIEEIQKDYLTSTDKTQLEDDIKEVSGKATANASAIEILNGEGDGSVKQSIDNAFNEFAANVTNDDVVNTYKELIDYAATHGPEFATLVGKVDTINTHVGEFEADLSNYKTVVSDQFTEVDTTINNHVTNTNNPHGVTKEDVGLANVDNTSDLDKPISYATQAALDEKADFEHIHEDATTTVSGFMSASDKAQLIDLQTKVGDTSVSDQITHAIAEHVNVSGNIVYTQNDEPTDAADGSLWIDLDAEGAPSSSGSGTGAGFVAQPEAPEDTSVLWLDTDDDSAESSSSSSGAGIKHKSFIINFLPSDFVDVDPGLDVTLTVNEEKTEEMGNLLAELSKLKTILVNVTVSIPGIGELFRYPVNLNPKNDILGINGGFTAIYSCSFITDGNIDVNKTYAGDFEAMSFYKGGINICPNDTRLFIAQYGSTLTIDTLYL